MRDSPSSEQSSTTGCINEITNSAHSVETISSLKSHSQESTWSDSCESASEKRRRPGRLRQKNQSSGRTEVQGEQPVDRVYGEEFCVDDDLDDEDDDDDDGCDDGFVGEEEIAITGKLIENKIK